MRLIDTDALLLELELLYEEADAKYHETDFDSFYGGGCSMIQEVIKGVEKQPAVYNVDKVVGQLEAEQQKYAAQALETDDTDEVIRCTINEVAMQTAIEIVKRGGEDEI